MKFCAFERLGPLELRCGQVPVGHGQHQLCAHCVRSEDQILWIELGQQIADQDALADFGLASQQLAANPETQA